MEDYFLVNAALKRVKRLGTHYGSVVNYPLFTDDSRRDEAGNRTWYLSKDVRTSLDLAMALGHEAGALLPTFQPQPYTRGAAFLLQPKNNPLAREFGLPRGPASTWALKLGDKQWSMADGHVIPEELLIFCTPEHRIRDNVWDFQPVLDHGSTLSAAGRKEFQLQEISTRPSSTHVVPREINPVLEDYFHQSVRVVPWGMIVQQGISSTCTLPDDLCPVPAIPDTHKLAGMLVISVPTAPVWLNNLKVDLFIGEWNTHERLNLCSLHTPPSTTITHWLSTREGTHLRLRMEHTGVNIVLVFAVMAAINKCEVIPRVVRRVINILDAVPCFGLILPHSYTSPVHDSSGLQPLDAQLWTALQSDVSLEVMLQPVLFEHTFQYAARTMYTAKVYPFDWKDIMPPVYNPAVPVGEQKQHPWGCIDFVMSTSIHLCAYKFAFMPSIRNCGMLSGELLRAGGILGLELLAHNFMEGNDENPYAVHRSEQTVRVFGMSILVRNKED
jgi:hypothetical protein